MKAAFIKKIGDAASIEYGDLPMPKIKENEVLVKVLAVGVNPIDTYIRSGNVSFENSLPMPFIIGSDAVGVVTEVGSGVESFMPGERVWTNSLGIKGRQGSFAEFIVVEEGLLYPAPDGVDDATLVAVAHTAATACIGLIRVAMLKTAEVIFINGGAGGVGSAVIQLAVARGARVIAATNGKEKMEWCKSLGAELVLDYTKDDYSEKIKSIAPQGVDVFWDTSRNPDFEISVPLLALRGRIVLMAGYDAHPKLPVGPFYRKECTVKGFTLTNATTQELLGSAEIITRCLEENKLIAKIANVLPLSDAAKAHALIESDSGLWGKLILKP